MILRSPFYPEEILISNIIAGKSCIYCVKNMVTQFSKREKILYCKSQSKLSYEDEKD